MRHHALSRRAALAGLGGVLAAPALPRGAAADTPYPGSQPVSIALPYAPGGAPDVLAQVLTQGLSARLGGTFVMEHKPGASTTLAARHVARAKPDGNTLLMGTVVTFTTAPYALRDPGYDAVKDFAHITMISDTQFLLVANPRWESLEALLAAARQRPGQLSFATWGVGTTAHLMMVDLMARTGTELLHVPYNGSPPALTDTIAGRTDLMFSTFAPARPHVESGRLRALAIPSTARSPALPAVPTLAELGQKDFVSSGWFTLSAPAGTPPAILAKLERAATEAFAAPEARARLDRLGLVPATPGPEALMDRLTREAALNRRLIQAAGIQPE
ncbi:Bug family tripartite tricarboxylate transporter substrate binding protein [Teichococcus aestuarii]|uniref:Bug family tripartite tricarboxylate transporter substrate binding protein n=1 Tax=Teichococcus aestuarii TaxID=568898 RepID=UPI003620C106